MKTMRVGIIGQGRSGRDIHAHFLQTVPERFKIVVVADVLKDRCARARQELGCAATQDYRDLLKRDDLDLIVNAAPSHLHVPITKEILRSGHNALCEKPLARRAKDVDDLVALSKKTHRLLAIYQQSRFAPYFEQVRKVIASRVLGRIVMIKAAFNGYARRWDWQTLQANNGGNLLNTGPHAVDQVLMLFDPKGAMPRVWCRMDRANTYGDAEDHVKLLLWGKGRPTIDLDISSCCAYSPYTYQVYGTRGGLTCTSTAVKWKHFDPKKAPRQKLIRAPLPGPSYCREDLPWVEESWEQPKEVTDLFDTMAGKFYANLYDVLTTKRAKLIVTPEQVRRQIAVIEEAHRQNPLSRKH